MKPFNEIKSDILVLAKEYYACTAQFTRAYKAENAAQLLEVITDNWYWVFQQSKMIDYDYLKNNFTEDELTGANIYLSGYHKISNGIAYVFGSATVKAYDSATVEAYDRATVEACGRATVKAYDSATVKAYGRATVKAYGSATVEAFDSATVKAYGNSYIEDCKGGIKPAGDFAIVKDYYAHKIYIKKGKFEIIEID